MNLSFQREALLFPVVGSVTTNPVVLWDTNEGHSSSHQMTLSEVKGYGANNCVPQNICCGKAPQFSLHSVNNAGLMTIRLRVLALEATQLSTQSQCWLSHTSTCGSGALKWTLSFPQQLSWGRSRRQWQWTVCFIWNFRLNSGVCSRHGNLFYRWLREGEAGPVPAAFSFHLTNMDTEPLTMAIWILFRSCFAVHEGNDVFALICYQSLANASELEIKINHWSALILEGIDKLTRWTFQEVTVFTKCTVAVWGQTAKL